MASAFQFGFADPNNFSDFAKYAGFDRKSGTINPYDLGQEEGVAPPANMQELFQQKVVNPFNKRIEGIKQQGANLSNAVDQFGQGNFVQGMNAARGLTPTAGAQQAATSSSDGWNLVGHLGLD
jgi:hypothetical protein